MSSRDLLAEFATLIVAGSTEIEPATAAGAVHTLRAHLHGKYPGIAGDDLTDVIHEAIARLTEKSRAGAVLIGDGGRPAGYLLRTAENLLIDQLRSARWNREQSTPHEQLSNLALTDDEAATTLDRRATVGLVRQVLTEVQAGDDATSFQVATYMLNETQRTGRVPSNRRTARACGISHTAVADALVRLRRCFARAR